MSGSMGNAAALPLGWLLLAALAMPLPSCSGNRSASPPDSVADVPGTADGMGLEAGCGDRGQAYGDLLGDGAGGCDAVGSDCGPDGRGRADGDMAEVAAPGCLEPLAGIDLGYAGPTELASTDPAVEVFLAEVDDAFALAALSDPPVTLVRDSFPVYDYKPEDSPKGRLAWEYRVRHGHFDNPGYLQAFESQLSQAGGDTALLLSFLSDKVDAYVEPGSVLPLLQRADELAAQPGALACAVQALAVSKGDRPGRDDAGSGESADASGDTNDLPATWAALPGDMQQAVARFLFAAHFSDLLRKQAMAGCAAKMLQDDALYGKALTPTFGALSAPDGLEVCGNGVDFRQLLRGAQLLSLAAETLANQAAAWDVEQKLELDTALGRVVIAGKGKNMHKAKDADHLLVMDLGGDDTYLDGLAASRPSLPLAVVIDLAGNDLYTTQGTGPAIAAGFLGYGILLDRTGDDTYSARYDSVGAACLGVAVLKDDAGTDFYDSVDGAQASAQLGVALLLDMAGDDHYYAFRGAQGMGSYRGGALLLDRSGNDFFEAEDDEVLYPAAQNPKYNANMSQGAGYGLRNDSVPFTDTYCGGIGMLADLEGSDIYSGGIFSQAVGYWFGIGFLIDSKGDDSYSGVWYNQGAAAHFAGGALLDSAGNDTYFCVQDQCMGEGRDYSIGTLVELAGDDDYYAKNGRNIGSGDLFGSGIFWDAAGQDSYKDDTPWAIGFVTTEVYVENSFTFGLFLDTGGQNDSYELPSEHAVDSALWTQIGNSNDGVYTNVVAVGRDK